MNDLELDEDEIKILGMPAYSSKQYFYNKYGLDGINFKLTKIN